jgi:hypothetical protein
MQCPENDQLPAWDAKTIRLVIYQFKNWEGQLRETLCMDEGISGQSLIAPYEENDFPVAEYLWMNHCKVFLEV